MTKRLHLAAVAVMALAVMPASLAQTIGSTGTVPGGITLVPGTVVTPLVGGSAATGTVPLAGTIGSPGVRNFDPQLGAGAIPDTGALYPVAPYPQIAPPFSNQTTVPNALSGTPNAIILSPYVPNGATNPPPVTICPNGAISSSGIC